MHSLTQCNTVLLIHFLLCILRIPTLQQLGVTSSEKLYSNKAWIGGESVALKKIMTYCRARKEPCANTVSVQENLIIIISLPVVVW